MGRKAIPGLFKKGKYWHIDKIIGGRRICRSTKMVSLRDAEQLLAKIIEDTRQAQLFGVRPKRTFAQACEYYLIDKADKKSLRDDKMQVRILMPFLGDTFIDEIHQGTFHFFIERRKKDGVKTNTINHSLQFVRHLLNRASVWKDEHNLTWLQAPPKIELLKVKDQVSAYPLDWSEQELLFSKLPEHLHNVALFAVNTGCRDQEICNLRWEWEVPIDAMGISVFIVPGSYVKNGEDRLVVLNSIAREVVEKVRGQHDEFVFTFRSKPIQRIMSSAWKRARKECGLRHVRVHDLKHTYGSRLRAAEVSFEDRQDLLGHKSQRVTTHYSRAALQNLVDASEKVCTNQDGEVPALVILRRNRKSF